MKIASLRAFIRFQAVRVLDIAALAGSWLVIWKYQGGGLVLADAVVIGMAVVSALLAASACRSASGLATWSKGAAIAPLAACLMAALALLLCGSALTSGVWHVWILIAPLALLALRGLGWAADRAMLCADLGRESVVLIGTSSACAQATRSLGLESSSDSKVVATLHVADVSTTIAIGDELIDRLQRLRSPRVIICTDDAASAIPEQILAILRHHPVTVQWAPQMSLPDAAFNPAYRAQLIDLCASPLNESQLVLKWIEDKFPAVIILAIVVVPMALIALAIKLTSPGPILFTQVRHGLNGRLIRVFKFRTMRHDPSITDIHKMAKRRPGTDLTRWLNDVMLPGLVPVGGRGAHPASEIRHEMAPARSAADRASSPTRIKEDDYRPTTATFRQTDRNDPRLAPLGKFLRQTSLDELPQLFNVLRGDMSLVGPRPHAVEHNHQYSAEVRRLMQRHYIKPGITGLAQISGARGATRTVGDMRRRVALDLLYMRKWSLMLDAKILLLTAFRGFITHQP